MFVSPMEVICSLLGVKRSDLSLVTLGFGEITLNLLLEAEVYVYN
jgi:hypothetical protein